MYVTLEPCPMCAGAIVQARIPSVVIGCMNPKAGCAGSVLDMLHEEGFNHQAETRIGILGETCSAMLSDFSGISGRKAEQKAEQKARQLMDGDRPADTAGKHKGSRHSEKDFQSAADNTCQNKEKSGNQHNDCQPCQIHPVNSFIFGFCCLVQPEHNQKQADSQAGSSEKGKNNVETGL